MRFSEKAAPARAGMKTISAKTRKNLYQKQEKSPISGRFRITDIDMRPAVSIQKTCAFLIDKLTRGHIAVFDKLPSEICHVVESAVLRCLLYGKFPHDKQLICPLNTQAVQRGYQCFPVDTAVYLSEVFRVAVQFTADALQ